MGGDFLGFYNNIDINYSIMFVIKFLVNVFWGLFGLFFWIPLLTRVLFTFVGRIIFDTVSGKTTNSENINLIIDASANFYINGFKKNNAKFNNSNETFDPNKFEIPPISFFTLSKNIIWAIIFWIGVFYPLISSKINATIPELNLENLINSKNNSSKLNQNTNSDLDASDKTKIVNSIILPNSSENTFFAINKNNTFEQIKNSFSIMYYTSNNSKNQPGWASLEIDSSFFIIYNLFHIQISRVNLGCYTEGNYNRNMAKIYRIDYSVTLDQFAMQHKNEIIAEAKTELIKRFNMSIREEVNDNGYCQYICENKNYTINMYYGHKNDPSNKINFLISFYTHS